MYFRLKKYILAISAVAVFSLSATAGYPKGYYDSLEGLKGYALMKAVKAVAKNHTEISYGDKTWQAFRSTDVRVVNGKECWWDMYSNDNVAVSSGHGGMNIEHSVANSWWGHTKNAAYKDIVHLNPSNSTANSRKSNYPLGEIATVTWDNGVTFVGKPVSGQGGGNNYVYEPHDDYKGDFARVFMYMFTIYDDISWKSNTSWMYDTGRDLMFKDWAVELLLKWAAADPVSRKEENRNDGIYKEQKNRNPFIDLPELAEHIWGSKSNQPFHLDGSSDPDPDPDPVDPDPVDPTPGPDGVLYSSMLVDATSIDPQWTIDNTDLPSSTQNIWQWDKYEGQYYLKGSAYVNKAYSSKSYIYSPVISLDGCKNVTMTFDHAAKFQTSLRNLCRPVIRQVYDSGKTSGWIELNIPTWPDAGSWKFVNSGNISLEDFEDCKIQIGFKYESTANEADTWEIRNIYVKGDKPSGIYDILDEDCDDSFLVEVWGNNICAPEGSRIFDVSGREVSGHSLRPGLYIVVKDTFKSAVKVLIR